MQYISPSKQKFLLFIDEKPILALCLGFMLIALVIILLSPFVHPIPVPSNVGGVIITHPITVIPLIDTEYTIYVRANEDIKFVVMEGNDYITFLTKKDISLGGETALTERQRTKITASFSHPTTNPFGFYYALLRLKITDTEGTRYEHVRIWLDTFTLPFRLILGVILATPSIQIFLTFLKRSRLWTYMLERTAP